MAAADAAEAAVATSTAFIVAASTCSVYSRWAPERNAPDETKNTTRGIVLLHERKELAEEGGDDRGGGESLRGMNEGM